MHACSLMTGWMALLLVAVPSFPLPSLLAQTLPTAISPAWSAPYQSDLTDNQPVWFGRDGSALLGQMGRTNWLWVAADGQRATIADPYLGDPMLTWSIVQLTSRVLLAEVRTGAMATNSTWIAYRRSPEGTLTSSILPMAGTAFPPSGAMGTLNAGRSVTRSVSRIPPDGWFASEVETGSGATSTEPNRMLTMYKMDIAALEAGATRPVLAMERGEPLRLKIELESAGPMLVQTSEDLKNWMPWAALMEPGASVVLPVTDTSRARRFFMVQQLDGAAGWRNPWE